MQRMWVNQPSALQPYHKLHGTNVLVEPDYATIVKVHFLTGPIENQQMHSHALAAGWKENTP